MCSLRAKNLLNSNGIAEWEENGITNLTAEDFVYKKPVELDKVNPDVQPSDLSSQQALQGNIYNPLTPKSNYLSYSRK